MSLPVEDTEVLVAGGGAAGLTAAARLALHGRRVTVVSSAVPATALSSGRVLLDGSDAAQEWASFFLPQFRRLGAYYQYAARPVTALTNGGTALRQSVHSPLFDWTVEDGEVAVVGLIGRGDLDPDLACRELARSRRVRARPYWLSPSVRLEDDREGFLGEVGEALRDDLAEGAVVLPPLPSEEPYGLLAELRKRSGKRVLEPATPLSWPGRRFHRLVEATAVRLGVRVLRDRRVVAVRTEGGRAVEATLSSGGRVQTARFHALVAATGGLASGGLTVEGAEVVDPLGLLRVAAAPGKGIASPRLRAALSSGAVTRRGRAVTVQGDVLANVVVAGSLCQGLSYPLGKGLGDVLVHAWKAARTVEEVL